MLASTCTSRRQHNQMPKPRFLRLHARSANALLANSPSLGHHSTRCMAFPRKSRGTNNKAFRPKYRTKCRIAVSFHMPSGSANIFGQAQDKGVRKAGVAKHPCHLGEKGFKLRPGTLLKAAALHALRQLYAILRHLMQALHVKITIQFQPSIQRRTKKSIQHISTSLFRTFQIPYVRK